MPRSHYLHFIAAEGASAEPCNQFGGQPNWVDKPSWPISRSTGKPMHFIAQIDLHLVEGYRGDASWAYLFLSSNPDFYTGENDVWIEGTEDEDGGENCVLLQPGNFCSVDTQSRSAGPSLYQITDVESRDTKRSGEVWARLISRFMSRGNNGRPTRQILPCRYAIRLEQRVDPPYIAEGTWTEEQIKNRESYDNSTMGNKIGGTPHFIQGDPIFLRNNPHEWVLALQLDSSSVPFFVDFGDDGVGYVFVKADGTDARFTWSGY